MGDWMVCESHSQDQDELYLLSPIVHLNGHIEVVPVGEGWTVEPFGGIVRNGRRRKRRIRRCGMADPNGPGEPKVRALVLLDLTERLARLLAQPIISCNTDQSRQLDESGDSGDALAHNQGMDIVSPLVGNDRL